MKRPSRKPAANVKHRSARPIFKPLWTEQQAIDHAVASLAPDSIVSFGIRLIALTLSKTPEQLMRGALAEADGNSPAEEVVKILDEVENHLKARLEMLVTARARVLWAACHVYGVEFPSGKVADT